jgi:hypothetical protein
VHRAIRGLLSRQPISETIEAVQTLTDHLSMTERRADDATREVTRWLKAEYMMDKIGEELMASSAVSPTSASSSSSPKSMWMAWCTSPHSAAIITISIRSNTA